MNLDRYFISINTRNILFLQMIETDDKSQFYHILRALSRSPGVKTEREDGADLRITNHVFKGEKKHDRIRKRL